jgi:hypothetical protein
VNILVRFNSLPKRLTRGARVLSRGHSSSSDRVLEGASVSIRDSFPRDFRYCFVRNPEKGEASPTLSHSYAALVSHYDSGLHSRDLQRLRTVGILPGEGVARPLQPRPALALEQGLRYYRCPVWKFERGVLRVICDAKTAAPQRFASTNCPA